MVLSGYSGSSNATKYDISICGTVALNDPFLSFHCSLPLKVVTPQLMTTLVRSSKIRLIYSQMCWLCACSTCFSNLRRCLVFKLIREPKCEEVINTEVRIWRTLEINIGMS